MFTTMHRQWAGSSVCSIAQYSIQRVAGSISLCGEHFFVEIGHEIFSTAIDSSRTVVCYWQNNVHYVLVNHLGLSLPRKSVIRLSVRARHDPKGLTGL